MITVTANCDGASKGNPGNGGWGVYLQFSTGSEEKYFGSEFHTTNNRMELTAVIQALKKTESLASSPMILTIITDSMYVKKGITEWIHTWIENNWLTAKKYPVANVDLWKELHSATKNRQVIWKWVKGHSGDPGNDVADRLANFGATGDPKYAC